jgi:hypothetical protein
LCIAYISYDEAEKFCFYNICRKLSVINKAAETIPCKPPVPGDSSTDLIEFPGKNYTF